MIKRRGLFPTHALSPLKAGTQQAEIFANSRMNFFSDTDTCDYAISLELKSNNTLIFKSEKAIGYWPDSAVMVRTDSKSPIFTDNLSHFYK